MLRVTGLLIAASGLAWARPALAESFMTKVPLVHGVRGAGANFPAGMMRSGATRVVTISGSGAGVGQGGVLTVRGSAQFSARGQGAGAGRPAQIRGGAGAGSKGALAGGRAGRQSKSELVCVVRREVVRADGTRCLEPGAAAGGPPDDLGPSGNPERGPRIGNPFDLRRLTSPSARVGTGR
jgi:hypothetical protein